MNLDEIVKLELKEGDVLVLKSDAIDELTLNKLREQIRKVFPNLGFKVPIIAMGQDDSIFTLPKEDLVSALKFLTSQE